MTDKYNYFHFDSSEFFLGPEKWILNPSSHMFKYMKKIKIKLEITNNKETNLKYNIEVWAWGECKSFSLISSNNCDILILLLVIKLGYKLIPSSSELLIELLIDALFSLYSFIKSRPTIQQNVQVYNIYNEIHISPIII